MSPVVGLPRGACLLRFWRERRQFVGWAKKRSDGRADSADRGVHATLLNVVKAGLIRQLPNGNFAPATVLDTIRLRRAM